MLEIRLFLSLALLLMAVAALRPATAQAKDPGGFIRLQNLREPDSKAQNFSTLNKDMGCNRIDDGEYFLDVRPHEKRKFFLQTRLVQIRAAEASLIIQSSDTDCRVAVITGEAVLKNLSDRSMIRIGAGEVYETIATTSGTRRTNELTQHLERWEVPGSKMSVFKSGTFATNLFAIDSEAVPAELQEACNRRKSGKWHYPTQAYKHAEILSPPMNCHYEAGPQLQANLPIPAGLIEHFPPSGVINEQAQSAEQLMAESPMSSVK